MRLSECVSVCGVSSVSYPPPLSRTRERRSDIRVKTPVMAGEYTEYTSLLQDMGAAIAAAAVTLKELYWHGGAFTDRSGRYTTGHVTAL